MRYLFFIFLVLNFGACKKDHAGCLDSEGDKISSTRGLPGFTGIDVNDKFDVYLLQDHSAGPSVRIECGQNILTGITTEVRDSILYIRNENRCNFVRNLKKRISVYVYSDRFTYITLRQAAKVISNDTIRTPSIYINSSSLDDLDMIIRSEFVDARGYNSGGLTIKGKAQLVACTVEDVCVLNTEKMDINDMYIYHYGRKHAYVNGKKILGAYIYNSANVYYSTDPEIKLFSERTGSGNLIKK